MNFYLRVIAAAFVFVEVFSSCHEDSISSRPDRRTLLRDYRWTQDTLHNIILNAIWGNSANDVYVGGETQFDTQPTSLLWRFDGQQCKAVDLPVSPGSETDLPASAISSLYGFGPSDVWAVGRRSYGSYVHRSLVLHYDGVVWRDMSITGARAHQSVWGSAPNDVWVASDDGSLYHFDGLLFTSKIPSYPNEKWNLDGYSSLAGSVQGKSYYLYVTNASSPAFYYRTYLLERQGDDWVVVGNSLYDKGPFAIWMSPDGALFGFNTLLYRPLSGNWVQFGGCPKIINSVTGTSANDLLAAVYSTWSGRCEIHHFDGTNRTLITDSVAWIFPRAVWTTGDEVFVAGGPAGGNNPPHWSLVLHGK